MLYEVITLIRTINQLEPIDKGRLIVDGMDLSHPQTNINTLRAEIGFVFQQFNLYPHLSVLKNITLAPIKIVITSYSIHYTKLYDRRCDHGYYFPLGKSALSLHQGGKRQEAGRGPGNST